MSTAPHSHGWRQIGWRDSTGQRMACVEKINVLAENLTELQALAQDVLEESLVLGVDEGQIRNVLADLIKDLKNPYAAS